MKVEFKPKTEQECTALKKRLESPTCSICLDNEDVWARMIRDASGNEHQLGWYCDACSNNFE